MKGKLVGKYLFTVLLCVFVLAGCADKKTETAVEPTPHYNEFQKVEHVGQIPDEIKKVVENNAFKDISAFGRKLLKSEICATDRKNKTVTQKVEMMDIYGNELASYAVSSDDAYHVTTLTATNDGGFLFVLGFADYAYDQNVWAGDNGFASRIIKCDKDGNMQFDTPINGVEGSALEFCFEQNGQYFLFGTIETPETKTQGVHSPTDIYMTVLDGNGSVLKSKCIEGSDYDSLDAIEQVDNGFWLSISSQSGDGDFAESNSNGFPVDWVIAVNDDLEITEKRRDTGRDYFDARLGEKEGITIYKSDELLKNFDAGTPTSFIDYGDFYLIISENITGEYENTPPTLSSIWYYTETVYSGYDDNGNLIFRTAVDSSTDYDATLESLNHKSEVK